MRARPTPRHRHYAEFYGLCDHDDGRPVGWVHGNCQAESLRLQLEGPDLRTVRVPPVHELEPADLPHLERLAARTDVWVSQPVRPDYRGLPVGSGRLGSLMPGALAARVPVVRFAGLYPTQVIVRPPHDPALTPPLVAYHDVTTLWEARPGGPGRRLRLDVGRVRAVAAHSVGELRRREQHHGTVPVSDLFERPRFAQMRTLNHPGNSVWLATAVRVRRRLGLDEVVTPVTRELLDDVHAPRSEVVVAAFGLDPGEVTDHWTVAGSPVPVQAVRESHLAWYARHPGTVTAGLERHRDLLRLLGVTA